MCGIVGLFCKSPELEPRLGEYLSAMLVQMDSRGPDSAGVAVYRDPAPPGWSKLSLYSADPEQDWNAIGGGLEAALGGADVVSVRAKHAIVLVEADADEVDAWIRRRHPDVRVMSAGRAIEIYKEAGTPRSSADAFALPDFQGSHALGHTRMATES